MVQIIVRPVSGSSHCLSTSDEESVLSFTSRLSLLMGIPSSVFYLTTNGGGKSLSRYEPNQLLSEILEDGSVVEMKYRLCGGIDFQHREGSKIGSGGNLSESHAAMERKERLRKLALETIDITKDPYILRNHLGTFECKLCLTLHNNEGNYLAHTQGKRHQVTT
jgi:splicing factor 3A subunit 2